MEFSTTELPSDELELLALIETLKRFRGILHGTQFTVRTDHCSLEHLMKQRNLSARQHQWLDVLNEFDFTIRYIPGETNGLADALSRIYSDKPEGVVWADSEFIEDEDDQKLGLKLRSHPIYVDSALLWLMNAEPRRLSQFADKPTVNYKQNRDWNPRKDDVSPMEGERDHGDELPSLEEVSDSGSDETAVGDYKETAPNAKERQDAAGKFFQVMSDKDIDFPNCLKGHYNEDKFFGPILENPNEFTNFETRDGLVFYRSDDIEHLAVPDVTVHGQSIREMLT